MYNKKSSIIGGILLMLLPFFMGCSSVNKDSSAPELLRLEFTSTIDSKTHQYFVYLPKGYQSSASKTWPLMLFLHGNGERGDGNEELDYVLTNGPVYEAWIQKKDIPFIIISPQLPMFDQEQDYMKGRQLSQLPQRMGEGTPERSQRFDTPQAIERSLSAKNMDALPPLLPEGWDMVEDDLLQIVSDVNQHFRTDKKRQYLTGLSYGGFGTWYMASKYPEMFTAIAPVVGWGHPSLMKSIADIQLPVWQFAGGRDSSVPIENFYLGLDSLEKLGHRDVRFTVHEDMGHDAWTRVYSSTDLYDWFLTHSF